MAKQLEVFHIYVGRLTHLISTLLNGHILLRREISKKKKKTQQNPQMLKEKRHQVLKIFPSITICMA